MLHAGPWFKSRLYDRFYREFLCCCFHSFYFTAFMQDLCAGLIERKYVSDTFKQSLQFTHETYIFFRVLFIVA